MTLVTTAWVGVPHGVGEMSANSVLFCLCRLHVVSVRWLVDCLKQSRIVNEADYICFDTAPDAAAAAASTATNRFAQQSG